MHFLGYFSSILLDRPYIFFRNMHGRDDACRVSGVYACKFNVFHNCGDKCVGAVTDRVSLAFQGMVQETVDQDWTVRGHTDGSIHVVFHALVIIYDLHPASAEYIGWADHNRIADILCDGECFLHCRCHS